MANLMGIFKLNEQKILFMKIDLKISIICFAQRDLEATEVIMKCMESTEWLVKYPFKTVRMLYTENSTQSLGLLVAQCE